MCVCVCVCVCVFVTHEFIMIFRWIYATKFEVFSVFSPKKQSVYSMNTPTASLRKGKTLCVLDMKLNKLMVRLQ